MEPIETIQHNGQSIEIFLDETADNPRQEFCQIGTMLYASSRYLLGDEIATVEEMQEIANSEDVICLPVFAYIHGSVSLSTTGFSCPWDSGQCGIIYCNRENAKANWPNLEGEELREQVRKCLTAEVQEFSKYLSGEVYGYVITNQFGEKDSCWGFYSVDDAVKEAKNMVAPVLSPCTVVSPVVSPCAEVCCQGP